MLFNKKMIQSILEEHLWDKDIQQDGKFQCGFMELVEGITIELTAIQETERLLSRIHDETLMYAEEHNKSMRELEQARDAVIEFCKHHSTTDQTASSTTCDICGAEVPRDK